MDDFTVLSQADFETVVLAKNIVIGLAVFLSGVAGSAIGALVTISILKNH